ncbi:MAG: arylsulfatase A-like enzyme [Paenibacillaceae bacterium]|jgi:arylsulfatase A-like enzyme|nr:arylsulfatase A-like enzyme [Paenibacillaceae bacterium]
MSEEKKPNILVVISDHFQSKSATPDHPCITPNIQRLIDEGMFFSRAYTTTSICAPARASLMTGCYPTTHGIYNNYHTRASINKTLFDGIKIFPEYLRDARYNNYYYGKWHVTERNKEELGFIKESGHPDRRKVKSRKQAIENPPVVLDREGYDNFPLYGTFDGSLEEDGDYVTAVEAANRIGKNAEDGKPWCIFASFNAPHPPYVAHEQFVRIYDDVHIEKPASFDDDLHDKPAIYRRLKELLWSGLSWEQCVEAIKHIYASSTEVDALVGMLLDKLDETGQAEDTIVVFLSDHGDMGGAHGMFLMGVVAFDETYRIPIAVRWPGKIKHPGSFCDQFVRITDLAPTLLEAAGAEPLEKISGRSLIPFFEGQVPEQWPEEVFCMFNGTEFLYSQRMIFDRKYKYVFNAFDYDELYDLENDPGETINLARNRRYEEVKVEMSKRMWRWMKKEDDIYNKLQYPFQMLVPIGPNEEDWQ